MNIKAYRQACGYAYKLVTAGRKSHLDLVHDAYIIWHNKTKKDLFDEHPAVITKTIKLIHFSSISLRTRFVWRGEKYNRTFLELDKLNEESDSLEYLTQTPATQQELLINQDYFKNLKYFDKKVLALKMKGKQAKEIEIILKRSNPIISASIKRIKQL